MGTAIRVQRPKPARRIKAVHSSSTAARLVKASEIRARTQSPSSNLTVVRPKGPPRPPTTKEHAQKIMDSLFPEPPPVQADAKEA